MSKKKNEVQESSVEVLESALTKSEQFIENNQKPLIIGVAAVVLAVGIFIGYKRLYVAPMEKEAQSQSFAAEQYFESGQFELALNGDGNYLGFLDIVSSFGPTKTANLAKYYIGISYRELGDFSTALDYLKRFKTSDRMVGSVAHGAKGDCYVELGNLEKGVKQYVKAAKFGRNDFTSPIYLMKAGLVYEELGDMKAALEVYNEIKSKYPRSAEAREIEKYITRASLLK